MAVPSTLLSSIFPQATALSYASSSSSSSSPRISSSSSPTIVFFDSTNATVIATVPSYPDTTSSDYWNDPPDDDPPEDKRQGILYQYFFVIIAVALVVLVVSVCAFRRRRRLRKAINASNGRNALARDLESWQPTAAARRWAHNRFGTRHRPREEEDEGFNEYGEAPPPYKAQEAAVEAGQTPNNSASANMPAVPLRTLSRSGLGKPPGYNETLESPSISESPETPRTQQETSSEQNIRPSSSTQPHTTTLQPPSNISSPNHNS